MLCHSVAAYTLTVESWQRKTTYRDMLCAYHLHVLLSCLGVIDARKRAQAERGCT